MRWILSFLSQVMSAVYQKHKKYTPTIKPRCVVEHRQQKNILPFSRRPFMPSLSFFLTHFLSSAILVRALTIVNGFWFPWKRDWTRRIIIIFYLFERKRSRTKVYFALSNPSTSTFHPLGEVYIKNAWKWTFERFCISIFISKRKKSKWSSCSKSLCLSFRQV